MPYKNLEDKRKHDRAYDLEHKEEKIERAKKWNRTNRGKVLSRSHSRSYTLEILAERERRHLERLKTLMYYSNPIGTPVCNNCGEQDIDVLCLDHIDGGGNQERAKLGFSGGNRFYTWLRLNKYPKGLQVLCYNCNMKKARFERKKASLV